MSRSPSADDPQHSPAPSESETDEPRGRVTRRGFLRLGAVAGAGAPLAALTSA